MLCLIQEFDRAGQVSLGLSQLGHGQSQAISVLRQSGGVAQCGAELQVLGCSLEITALVQDRADADMHVRDAAADPRRLIERQLQCGFVARHRVAQATLCQADVGQGDRAAKHVSECPERRKLEMDSA